MATSARPTYTIQTGSSLFHWGLVLLVTIALAVSAYKPFDGMTWWMEVASVLIAAPVLFLTAKRFPLTRLLYGLIAFHALVLILGGHYSYARVPLGEWAKDWFGFTRNHYDRIGHFVQGFVPAIIAREIILRTTPLRPGKMLFFLVVCVCLAVSAVYELVEWAAALMAGEGATEFLGTQGDVWDTQTDMFLAGIGSLVSLITLRRWHDRELGQR